MIGYYLGHKGIKNRAIKQIKIVFSLVLYSLNRIFAAELLLIYKT